MTYFEEAVRLQSLLYKDNDKDENVSIYDRLDELYGWGFDSLLSKSEIEFIENNIEYIEKLSEQDLNAYIDSYNSLLAFK